MTARVERRYCIRLGRVCVVLLAAALLWSCAPRGGTEKSAAGAADAQPVSYQPPAAKRWVLSNGLTVLFLRDSELPLVSGTLYMPGGYLWEPDATIGNTSAMGDLLRQGGAGDLSADALDRVLEKLAASIGTAFGDEYGTVSFESLSSDVDRVFQIYSDVLLRPRFEESRLRLWKGRAAEGIRRRKDDPDTVAGIAFQELLYAGTPYSRVLSERNIAAISRSEIQGRYRSLVRPDQAILALSGDLTDERAEELVQRHLSSWQPRGSELPPAPPVPTEATPGIYFIELPFDQSTIMMGHLGVKRLSPDNIAIEAFNHIFGSGGFGSRLMERIRSELGLVYGIYGAVIPAVERGRNLIGLQTKAETTGEAISESMKILQEMQEEGARAAKLEETKDTITNSFIFRFDSFPELVRRYALLQLLKYPKDYDLTYLSRVRDLTVAEIQQVAQRRWDLGKFVIVVVGNETAYNSLKRLAENPPSFMQHTRIIRASFTHRLELPGNASAAAP